MQVVEPIDARESGDDENHGPDAFEPPPAPDAGRATWTAEIRWDPEVRWDQDAQTSCFYAVATSAAGDDQRVVGESREVEWPLVSDTGAQAVRAAVDDLEHDLAAAGWTAVEPGEAWYARRFAWRGAGAPPEVRPRPDRRRTLASRLDAARRARALSPVEARRRRLAGAVLASSAVALSALAVTAAAAADLREMAGLGLTDVLPLGFYVAAVGLVASFSVAVSRPTLHPVALAVHVVALIVVLHGIAPVIEESPRTQIAWKISGIPDYVLSHGRVDASIDAFFNWPGFFILVALFTRLSGFGNPTDFAAWAPVVFNTLFVLPVFLLARTATSNPRAPWLAVWFFLLGNWIGQDYLAPQAAGFLTFLAVMTILLTWFTRYSIPRIPHSGEWVARRLRAWSYQMERTPVASTPRQRAVLLAVIIVAFAALVPSHQLTPFVLIVVVGALVLVGSLATRGIPVIMLVFAFGWVSYMATGYLEGHFEQVVSPLGSVSENVDANYAARLQGSPDHVLVTYARSATSVLIWSIALLGAVRSARLGRLDVPSAVMALTPFGLLALQAYGGELLLRVYLFTLPAMAIFIAQAFLPQPSARPSARTTVAVGLASVVVGAGWMVSHYGDERMHYFTPEEIAGVERLYAMAPPGARLVALVDNAPWRYREYDSYSYRSAERPFTEAGARGVVEFLRSGERRTFFIVSRSQLARGETLNGWTPRTWPRLRSELLAAGAITRLYANRDVQIYAIVPAARS